MFVILSKDVDPLEDLLILPSPSKTPPRLPPGVLNFFRDHVIKNNDEVAMTKGKSRELSKEEKHELFYSNSTKRRFIFRFWPRAPKGKGILPQETLRGKETPNGNQLWGSTIADFFRTQRFYDIPGLSTVSTGSKLLRWMKENGEVESCKNEIGWAEREEDPFIVRVYDFGKLIREQEEEIRKGEIGESVTEEEEDKKKWLIDDPSVKDTIFDQEKSVAPWPIQPFSYEPVALNEKLPYYCLPKKLYVHTSQFLLQTSEGEIEDSEDEEDKPCQVWEYKLQLSPEGEEKLKKHLEELETRKQESKNGKSSFQVLPDPKSTTPGPIEPIISVEYPCPPPHPAHVSEEAHVYLSGKQQAGRGHHSVVYRAQLDLPRDTLVPDIVCKQCALDEAHIKIVREDGSNGEKKADAWKKKSARFMKEYVVTGDGMKIKLVKENKPNEALHTVNMEEGQWMCGYEGPVRNVPVNIVTQNPSRDKPYCHHIKASDISKHSPTARVRVIAKLSGQPHDEHLEKEAKNYQRFPEHFFEHWSGYNIIPPMQDPVPINALVPQFYGYYVPVQKGPWLSPILLLEDCGSEFNGPFTSVDDRNECVSLLYRFNGAGWAHGSAYQRNIVRQSGPLWKHPSERKVFGGGTGVDSRYSYRLIDFGRSDDVVENGRGSHAPSRIHEDQMEMHQLYDHLYKTLD